MAKLVTIQAIAAALDQEATTESFADALAEWIGTRELESQCLEALCPLLIATPKPAVIARIRRAVARPSLASDLLLSLATGKPVVLPSWTGCHSGPAPHLLTLAQEEQALGAGTFIPPLFAHKLEALQKRSGLPFLRQWAFEYSVLDDRCGGMGDGHLGYFLGSERREVGQFVSHKGHLARSAYLRVLACAVERWNMPEEIAVRYAAEACPAEPIFLRLSPQSPPSWALFAHGRTATDAADARALARVVIRRIEEELRSRIMHISLTVVDEPLCHAELEVFAVVRTHDEFDAQQAINFHHHMLGNATPARDGLRAFVSPEMGSDGTESLRFVPVVLPLVGASVGYLQNDFLGRVPYVPVSTKNVPKLELVPMARGAIMRSNGREVGTWNWWLWDWRPGHPQGWPTQIACCASLGLAAAQQVADDLGGSIEHVWKLTTWQRDQQHGEWRHTEQVGRMESRE
jgi:hypothetical protein